MVEFTMVVVRSTKRSLDTTAKPRGLLRREFLRGRVNANLAGLAVGYFSQSGGATAQPKASAIRRSISLDRNWLFGGRFSDDALNWHFDDRSFSKITLPHCTLSPLEAYFMFITRPSNASARSIS